MTLKVIGAGLGRTGTLSIKYALEELGLGPCYHMHNLFSSSEHLAKWQAVADGQPADWGNLFKGFDATVDWPGTLYWRELADAYPDAKVLLSVRPADQWWQSFEKTISKLIGHKDSVGDDHLHSVLDYAHQTIVGQTFGGSVQDKDSVIGAYQKRIDEVVEIIPAERLLEFDVTEGWQPLCQFLDVPVPTTEFPRHNDQKEFWQHFGAGVS